MGALETLTRGSALGAALAVALTVGALSGCSDGDPSATPAITATEYRFTGPSHFKAGVVEVTLRNHGALTHEAALVGIGEAAPAKALLDVGAVLDGGPIADYLTFNGGITGVGAGGRKTSRFEVKPGRYVLICTLSDLTDTRSHYARGMAREITVTGDAAATLAGSGASITARDYTFDATDLKAGENDVVFRNAGPAQVHHVVVNEFAVGVDEAAALRAFQTFSSLGPDEPPPPGTPEPTAVGESALFSPGFAGTFSVTLQPGRTYVLACFMQDKQGGAPHAFGHQMVTAFTVG